MPIDAHRLRARLEPLLQRVQRASGAVAGRSPKAQRRLLTVSAVAFIAMTVLAVRALPPLELSDRWPLLVLVGLVGVPLSMLANALEYVISGRIVGSRVGLVEAFRVTVLAMAANLLPLPGSMMVRTSALHGLGSGARRAATATLVVALTWVGVTGLVAGVLSLSTVSLAFGGIVTAGGAALTAVALVLLRASLERGRRLGTATALLATEIAMVTLGAVRFWLVLLALGFPAGLSQAAALVVAGVAAAATGIFPGGLGLRELIAGGISPLVGLPAALGLLATAINRLVEYVVLLPVSLILSARGPEGASTSSGSGVGPLAAAGTDATEPPEPRPSAPTDGEPS